MCKDFLLTIDHAFSALMWRVGSQRVTVVGQRSGLPPRPVCAGYGRWPGWLAALVSDESALEAAWPPAWQLALRRMRRCAI